MTEEKKKSEVKAEDKKDKATDKTSEQAEQNNEEKTSEDIKEPSFSDEPEKLDESEGETKKEEPVLEKSSDEKEVLEEPKEETKVVEEVKEQPVSTDTSELKDEVTEAVDKKPESKKKPVEGKPDKKGKKKDEKDEDFQYIVRIANTDIDGDRTIVMGLSQIKGIGRHMANLIADASGIDKKTKMGKLSDKQIEKIRELLDGISTIAPGWMLNHRKDIDTGEDVHLISSDVDLKLRDDVNLLKMIRSYRGIRHESSLPVRGQRTRANNRRGLALGVSKKRS